MATKYTIWRLTPVIFVSAAAAAWFADVQASGPYVMRNLVPLMILIVLCAVTLHRGGGHWMGSGKRLAFGVVGYAIPALGLAAYLHFAYATNLDGMFTEAPYPERVFRYLPVYTIGAGGIGFAIGWIVGRNV